MYLLNEAKSVILFEVTKQIKFCVAVLTNLIRCVLCFRHCLSRDFSFEFIIMYKINILNCEIFFKYCYIVYTVTCFPHSLKTKTEIFQLLSFQDKINSCDYFYILFLPLIHPSILKDYSTFINMSKMLMRINC